VYYIMQRLRREEHRWLMAVMRQDREAEAYAKEQIDEMWKEVERSSKPKYGKQEEEE
jgi:hypothetical protein